MDFTFHNDHTRAAIATTSPHLVGFHLHSLCDFTARYRL
jgi:hypothetical protein